MAMPERTLRSGLQTRGRPVDPVSGFRTKRTDNPDMVVYCCPGGSLHRATLRSTSAASVRCRGPWICRVCQSTGDWGRGEPASNALLRDLKPRRIPTDCPCAACPTTVRPPRAQAPYCSVFAPIRAPDPFAHPPDGCRYPGKGVASFLLDEYAARPVNALRSTAVSVPADPCCSGGHGATGGAECSGCRQDVPPWPAPEGNTI